MISPERMIEVIQRRFGIHHGHPALHSKGAFFAGTFTAMPEAAALTTAAHMQGTPIEVIARLSNGSGDPNIPDYAPDVRGLAVGFQLPDGRTDILAQTTPKSPVGTPEAFAQLIEISRPGVSALLKLPLFLVRNPKIATSGRVNNTSLNPPASFATRPYWAFHAFRWTGPDGSQRWVRYTFQPEDATPDPSRGVAKAAGRDYLFEEMSRRLAEGPARWTLQVQIAGERDNPHDSTSYWPSSREKVDVGVLELTAPIEPDDPVIFDPMRLTDGIEPSDDPILLYRPAAYSVSYANRTA